MYHLTHNGQPISKPHPHRCTCEVGNWAVKHIADITEQRDKLLAVCEEIYGYFGDDFWDSSGMSDETRANLKAAIAEAKGAK